MPKHSPDPMNSVDPFGEARLGPVTLRNRIIKAATFEGVMPEALVTPELIEYHRAVAAGGAGMSTVAYLAVAPEGRTHAECIWLRPEAVPGLRQLTNAIHAEGAGRGRPDRPRRTRRQLPVQQGRVDRAQPAVQPSGHAGHPLPPPTPISPRITNDYARAARLAADGGFDAIEIHLGHNYLLSAFLSPNLNKRTDAWGGSLANRARFGRQAVQAVRAAVGDKLAVTAKVNMNDGVPGGPQGRREPRVRPDAPGRRRPRRPWSSPAAAPSPTPCTCSGATPPADEFAATPPAPRPARLQAGRGQAHARLPPSRRPTSCPRPGSSSKSSTCR